jgi:putative ABC transport system permease protein
MKREPSRRWSRIFKLDARTEVEQELAFHLEQRVRANIARGMDEEAARAAAHERFGDVKTVRAECTDLLIAERRTEARREWMKMSWLDFKLGFRMLVKYPGLTLVGGLALVFAIWVSASAFELIRQAVHPSIPLPQGDRLVRLRNWDTQTNRVEARLLQDFVTWREALKSVEAMGAYSTVTRNLAVGNRVAEPVAVAEITTNAFSLAGIRPLMGRTLLPADEQPAAPPVIVIGYHLWHSRFDAAGDVIGQTVKLGGVQSTIVGVMPEGFGFPISHSLWSPLRLNPLEYARRDGPGISVFGRLARGASLEQAEAELTTLGQRASADFPDTHAFLRPQILPYAKSVFITRPDDAAFLMSFNLLLFMLLVLICGNVGLLMFARAATRESEIIVRNALGASRGRIIAQLFAEALVLGTAAAALGLAAAGFGLRWVISAVEADLMSGDKLPFWFTPSLSPSTIVYVVLLTLLGAAIAGVLPALKVTRGLQARLREAAAGSGLSVGGVWTVVIVAQIAVTVAFPFFGFMLRREAVQLREFDVGIPDHEYLTVRLRMDRTAADGFTQVPAEEFAARYRANYLELERRLEAEPAVTSVTYADELPRMNHPAPLVDLDPGGGAPLLPQWPGYRVSSAWVDPGFFDALEVPIIAGRGFRASDVGSDHTVIIVNESFVKRVLGGRNAIGRRIKRSSYERDSDRKAAPDEPWYEIIGVVKDLGMSVERDDPRVAGFYLPAAPGAADPMRLVIHVKGDPAAFGPRLRSVATSVDPSLRLYDLMPLSQVSQGELQLYAFWFRMIAIVSAIALMLSLSSIYAVMAFTVSRRTREIGIRMALGSKAGTVVAAILRRPLTQVALGILAGATLIAVIAGLTVEGKALGLKHAPVLSAYALLMMAVCMLACIVPARRALRVQPIDALKAD